MSLRSSRPSLFTPPHLLRELVLGEAKTTQAVPTEGLLLSDNRIAFRVSHSLNVTIEEDMGAPCKNTLGGALHKASFRAVLNVVDMDLVLVLGVERDNKDGGVCLAGLLHVALACDRVSLSLGEFDKGGLGSVPHRDPIDNLELTPISLDGNSLERDGRGVAIDV